MPFPATILIMEGLYIFMSKQNQGRFFILPHGTAECPSAVVFP